MAHPLEIKPPPGPSNIRGINPKFTREEQLFMWDFALALAAKGIVKMVDYLPETLLSVFCAEKTDNEPGKDKAYRFLANGRPLKQFMEVPHFRLEDLASLINQLKPGVTYHCIKVDFKDAYLISAAPSPKRIRRTLGFVFSTPITSSITSSSEPSARVLPRALTSLTDYSSRCSATGAATQQEAASST